MKKHALIVANLFGFGGFLLHDMELLIQLGYDVTFAAHMNVPGRTETRDKLEQMGVTIVQIDFDSKNPFSKANRTAYHQLKTLLKNRHYDFIHCHTPIAGLLTRLAARRQRKKGTPVIYTTHGFAFTSRSSRKEKLVYGAIERFGSRCCDAIITINREDYAAAQKMHCKKVYYIHGVGVDTQKFREMQVDRALYREKIGIPSDRIMILSVGELSVRKNHRIIIDAIALLPDKEKYIYVICGNGVDGGTGNELRSLATEKNVDLRLLGFRRDIPAMIKASDIGAIPSIREGLGLAGIESLAAGVPVVGADVQGIRDYMENGRTGYLCDPYDASAFASAIQKLVTERNILATDCRQIAQNFDISVSYAEMRAIYQEMLGVSIAASGNLLKSGDNDSGTEGEIETNCP